MPKILIIYYSQHGSTMNLARYIARGVNEFESAEAILRTVPNVSANTETTEPPVPTEGAPYATTQDLESCDGLILGSPTHFGNMTAAMKHFLDNTTNQWVNGSLVNKPAAVFTSSSSLHGGQESTLLSMMLPLLHHGMLMVGLPYTEPELTQTVTGGSPYGATHLQRDHNTQLSEHEKSLCRALGRRVAKIAHQLH